MEWHKVLSSEALSLHGDNKVEMKTFLLSDALSFLQQCKTNWRFTSRPKVFETSRSVGKHLSKKVIENSDNNHKKSHWELLLDEWNGTVFPPSLISFENHDRDKTLETTEAITISHNIARFAVVSISISEINVNYKYESFRLLRLFRMRNFSLGPIVRFLARSCVPSDQRQDGDSVWRLFSLAGIMHATITKRIFLEQLASLQHTWRRRSALMTRGLRGIFSNFLLLFWLLSRVFSSRTLQASQTSRCVVAVVFSVTSDCFSFLLYYLFGKSFRGAQWAVFISSLIT